VGQFESLVDYLGFVKAGLFKFCGYVEAAAERIVRREVVIGLAIVYVLSFALASQSEALVWLNKGALIGLCLFVILWALNKGQQELLGKL
jgi:Flp pilus assembly protein protease CpaA